MPHRQICVYRAQGVSLTAMLAHLQGSRHFLDGHVICTGLRALPCQPR
jgi:hypothetical protein